MQLIYVFISFHRALENYIQMHQTRGNFMEVRLKYNRKLINIETDNVIFGNINYIGMLSVH